MEPQKSNLIYKDDIIELTLTEALGCVFLHTETKPGAKLSDFKRWLDVITVLGVQLRERGYTEIRSLVKDHKNERWNNFFGFYFEREAPNGDRIMRKNI